MTAKQPIGTPGQRFGKWLVLEVVGRTARGVRKCKCICDCGRTKIVIASNLGTGNSKSCGCRDIEPHGKTGTRTWQTWCNMKQRCGNPKVPHYRNYGGRGIKVCQEWVDSFATFLRDMGERPSAKHSLDRINNDGNYEPGNCRWATQAEQARNKRPRQVANG